jgi:putative chitinase
MNAEAQRLLAQIEQRLTDAAALSASLAALVQEAPTPAAPAPVELAAGSNGLKDPAGFYNWLRSNNMLGPKISPSEYQGCEEDLKACFARGHPIAWTAYELATDYHETAHTMQPIDEIGGTAYFTRMYDINGQRPDKARQLGNLSPGDGVKYHGRGKPQITGKANYQRMGKRLGVDLVNNPELAKDSVIASRIMAIGMEEGIFTGKSLADFLPSSGNATKTQFVKARPIVNGTDKADLIAGYAVDFQQALAAGGYAS